MPSITQFKDLAVSFSRNKITNDLLVKKDSAAVKQAVLNILLTNKGERLYDPEYGSNVRAYLFEQLDYGTAALIRDEIYGAVGRSEPRIVIQDLTVTPDYDENGFEVIFQFRIVGRDDIQSQQIDFFLNRAR
tara:strand:+ start:293 stop:688 length:396 start_codon:yes stop_codon:yes gene_type:complete